MSPRAIPAGVGKRLCASCPWLPAVLGPLYRDGSFPNLSLSSTKKSLDDAGGMRQ